MQENIKPARSLQRGVYILALTFSFAARPLSSQTLDFHGQLSFWGNSHEILESGSQIGLRYIPGWQLQIFHSPDLALDMEVSARLFGAGTYGENRNFTSTSDLDAYRLWVRLASSQLELRAGLQKISFGPAKLLRPLMWFDRIDPRDPLGLTEGVYGLLLRYTLQNNGNIWLWGLYGNNATKGWEIIPTQKRLPEFGGRVQWPLLSGEVAVSFHRRKVDFSRIPFAMPGPPGGGAGETRLAVDGFWDVGAGLWGEAAVVHQNLDHLALQYRHFFLVGSDYTLGIGNGVYVLLEHLRITLGRNFLSAQERIDLSAWAVRYSAGLLDNLQAIVFYHWQERRAFRFLSWGRVYDHWSFFTNFFWNPQSSLPLGFESETQANLSRGRGLQILVAYNH